MAEREILGSNAKEAVLLWRLSSLEKQVKEDHEPRIRVLETMASKVAVLAFLGGTIGAAVAAAIANYLIK